MIKCAKIFHIYFLSIWDSFFWIFYYFGSALAFYSLVCNIFIIYGKINI